MKNLIGKLLKKTNIGIVLMLILSIAVELSGVSYILASNEATQQASTAKATSISIFGKVADSDVSTITFPEGAPSATISAPYNNVDTNSDPQFLDGSASEPVVRLKNTSGGTLQVWLEITTWTNGIAASEDYELVDTTATNVSVVNDVLSADGNANSVDTAITMATTTYKALYLELALSSVAGTSGSSTLTILGETP